MFISGRGIINCLKSLNNHQYGQKFHFCFQFQPKFSKIGILFIGSPGRMLILLSGSEIFPVLLTIMVWTSNKQEILAMVEGCNYKDPE